MDRIVRRLTATWLSEARGERPARWTIALRPFEWLVSRFVGRRAELYDRGRGVVPVGLPVVSVGNLTVGGTNKTPTVAWLLGALTGPLGAGPLGVVTRGYGRSGPPRTFRGADLENAALGSPESILPDGAIDLGDEPRLLSSRYPDVWIAVDPDRVRGVDALEARGVRRVVADDAFQHRRLGRVFDLVLVDATCPWGNGRLLPAGILREPVAALARADAVLLTRSHEVDGSVLESLRQRVAEWISDDRIHPARLILDRWVAVPSRIGEVGSLSSGPPPAGSAIYVVTGIARPESLVRTVEAEGMEVQGVARFRDHDRIDSRQFARVEEAARTRGADLLVCSEKDVPNLPERGESGLPLWFPRIQMEIERGEDLAGRIERALDEGGAGRS